MTGNDERLWSGRFTEPPAPEAHALGRSLHFDVRLASQNVEAGIAHGTRGKPSPRRLEANTRDLIVALARTTYVDHNDCHLTQKLQGAPYRLAVSRTTVRKVRRAAGAGESPQAAGTLPAATARTTATPGHVTPSRWQPPRLFLLVNGSHRFVYRFAPLRLRDCVTSLVDIHKLSLVAGIPFLR